MPTIASADKGMFCLRFALMTATKYIAFRTEDCEMLIIHIFHSGRNMLPYIFAPRPGGDMQILDSTNQSAGLLKRA